MAVAGGGSGAAAAGAAGGSGWAAYYRCDVTRQLNDQYGDMQYKIQDLEVGARVGGRRLGAWNFFRCMATL